MEKAEIFHPAFGVVGVNANRGAATSSAVALGSAVGNKLSCALISIKLPICPRRTWYPAKPYPNTASGTMSGLSTSLQ